MKENRSWVQVFFNKKNQIFIEKALHIQAERHLRPEEDWFRVRMLLHSIDQLDKLMSFAVRGSALDIANEIPIVRLIRWFFK